MPGVAKINFRSVNRCYTSGLTDSRCRFQFLLALASGAFLCCLDVSLVIGFMSTSELIGAAQSILVSPFIDTQPDSDYR
jgi:hypothetical protein